MKVINHYIILPHHHISSLFGLVVAEWLKRQLLLHFSRRVEYQDQP
jgi:hypothetical protein